MQLRTDKYDQMKVNQDEIINKVTKQEYEHGFVTDIETETIPKGLN
jgi:hypothetical protein